MNQELLQQAIKVAKYNRDRFSIARLQIELKLDYRIAAEIVKQMEQMGYVGPFKDGRREVLI